MILLSMNNYMFFSVEIYQQITNFLFVEKKSIIQMIKNTCAHEMAVSARLVFSVPKISIYRGEQKNNM